MSFAELMTIRISLFWLLHKNIDRIKAGDDMRMLGVICSAWGGTDKLVTSLTAEQGEIIEISYGDDGIDRQGLKTLKSLFKR